MDGRWINILTVLSFIFQNFTKTQAAETTFSAAEQRKEQVMRGIRIISICLDLIVSILSQSDVVLGWQVWQKYRTSCCEEPVEMDVQTMDIDGDGNLETVIFYGFPETPYEEPDPGSYDPHAHFRLWAEYLKNTNFSIDQ